jgi:hypothetical protein
LLGQVHNWDFQGSKTVSNIASAKRSRVVYF